MSTTGERATSKTNSRTQRPRLARAALSRGVLVSRHRRVSLCETLDRVLNKGAVVQGDVIVSIAGVDLLYLGVNLVLTSVETMRNWDASRSRTLDERRPASSGEAPAAPPPTEP